MVTSKLVSERVSACLKKSSANYVFDEFILYLGGEMPPRHLLRPKRLKHNDKIFRPITISADLINLDGSTGGSWFVAADLYRQRCSRCVALSARVFCKERHAFDSSWASRRRCRLAPHAVYFVDYRRAGDGADRAVLLRTGVIKESTWANCGGAVSTYQGCILGYTRWYNQLYFPHRFPTFIAIPTLTNHSTTLRCKAL